MAKLERLPLDSPDWDDPALFKSAVGANVRIREIQNSPPNDRGKLIEEFIDWTTYEMPDIAFHYGSPYLVDILAEDVLAEDVGANWQALILYAATVMLAMSTFADATKQIAQDKYRISKLMVEGLEILDVEECPDYQSQDYFNLFLGCIASVHGNDVLGSHIRDLER